MALFDARYLTICYGVWVATPHTVQLEYIYNLKLYIICCIQCNLNHVSNHIATQCPACLSYGHQEDIYHFKLNKMEDISKVKSLLNHISLQCIIHNKLGYVGYIFCADMQSFLLIFFSPSIPTCFLCHHHKIRAMITAQN